MNTDRELEQWQAVWRSDAPTQASIEERARKAVRNFRRWVYLEIAVTVLFGGGTLAWALWAKQPSVSFLAVCVGVFIVLAWLFRLFNDWNDLSGAAVVTEHFLPILLRRLKANRRAAWFGGVFYFVQLVVVSSWVFRELNHDEHVGLGEFFLLPANLVFAAATLAFVVWLWIYCRRLNSEIWELEKLRSEMAEPVAASVEQVGILQMFIDAIWDLQQKIKRIVRLRV